MIFDNKQNLISHFFVLQSQKNKVQNLSKLYVIVKTYDTSIEYSDNIFV